MTVGEAMSRVSHREYLSWQEYLDAQWNSPDASTHYLMQIALEIRRVLHSKPGSVSLDDFKIEFKRKERVEVDPETAQRWSEMAWCAAVGLTIDKRK